MMVLAIDPDVARPGWVPLVILVVMFIALAFLFRSMRKMIRTIDPDLPSKRDVERRGATAATSPSADPAEVRTPGTPAEPAGTRVAPAPDEASRTDHSTRSD